MVSLFNSKITLLLMFQFLKAGKNGTGRWEKERALRSLENSCGAIR